MRRPWACASGAILILAALPAAAFAQGRRCSQTRESDTRRIINIQGQEVIYFRDPVRVVCSGGIEIRADSAVMNQGAGSVELVGQVIYEDTARQMTAEWANYLGRQEQLLARGNVVLTDLSDGSVITGATLDYLRATPTRPASRMIVQGGRPYALLRPAPPGPDTTLASPDDPERAAPADVAAGDTAAPLEVWSNRIEMLGDTLFRALGDVELARGSMTGAADSARYDQAAEHITLLGAAHVKDERYRLEGQRIDALLAGQELDEVHAAGDARLLSDELRVDAERLRIGFAAGTIERLEAWRPDAEPGRERAVAVAQDFTLRSDSIDALSVAGQLSEVRAVGNAFGERDPDSAAIRLPSVIARDWIQGDTIIGYFAQDTAVAVDSAVLATDALHAPPIPRPDSPRALVEPEEGAAQAAEPDSAGVVLERVVVIGAQSPALSLYRLSDDGEGTPRSINFMQAKRIILFMARGDVLRVEAEGPIKGLYLDPVTGQARPPAPAREGGG